MLTELKAYSAWADVPVLPLDDSRGIETDWFQCTNITGLDPVKASVNMAPLGSVDGASYVGSSVTTRNIVLTLRPNATWDRASYSDFDHAGLRKRLYAYFMPKRPVRLVFHSDNMDPVEITGIVESVDVNPFSKDPELLVSIICPDPYFISVDPKVITGRNGHSTVIDDGEWQVVTYNGDIETGVYLKVEYISGSAPNMIGVWLRDPAQSYFNVVPASVSSTLFFELNSVSMQKFVQNVDLSTGVIANLLSKIVQEGSTWPVLQPGDNRFAVITDIPTTDGECDYTLSYYERFGGL